MKNPPATWETWVLSLGREDPLEEGMATHSSILTRRIPWTEEPGGLQSMGSKRVRHDQATKHSTAHSDFIRIQNPPLINSGMDHQNRYLKVTLQGFQLLWLWGFPGGPDGKETVCNVGDLGSIPG